MLKEDVIEPARTEWANVILYVPKAVRLAQILCRLSKTERCNRQRLLSASLHRRVCQLHRRSRNFPSLDGNTGYWQVEIDENHPEKTAFSNLHSIYQFVQVLFGPKNVPANFYKSVDLILSSLKWQ